MMGSMTLPWKAPLSSTKLDATVRVPGSKSMTNRALVLAALAQGESEIRGALRSRDTELMIQALRDLGTEIHDSGPQLRVVGRPLGGASVDCGLAGTVMRFVPPLAAVGEGTVFFDGDAAARRRPMATTLDALRALGVSVDGSALPFVLRAAGAPDGGEVTIDASSSSQFVSGLLLSAPRYRRGMTVVHSGGPLPSLPHIDMTVQMLRQAGVRVHTAPNHWEVEPGPIAARTWEIEPDLSNATPFLAAAATTGGTVRIPHWPAHTTQAGDAFRDIAARMGCQVELDDSGQVPTLQVRGPQQLRGIDINLQEVGELAPTVAAMAAVAHGPSQLRGIAHLRGHETNRLEALAREINRLGGDCEETADGLIIRPRPLHGGLWHSYADHRMATAGAIVGLRVPGVEVEDIATTAKTLPGFSEMWETMVHG